MNFKLHRAETDRYGGNAVTECQGLRPIRMMSCRGEVKMGCHYPISFSEARSGKPKLKSKAKFNRLVQA